MDAIEEPDTGRLAEIEGRLDAMESVDNICDYFQQEWLRTRCSENGLLVNGAMTLLGGAIGGGITWKVSDWRDQRKKLLRLQGDASEIRTALKGSSFQKENSRKVTPNDFDAEIKAIEGKIAALSSSLSEIKIELIRKYGEAISLTLQKFIKDCKDCIDNDNVLTDKLVAVLAAERKDQLVKDLGTLYAACGKWIRKEKQLTGNCPCGSGKCFVKCHGEPTLTAAISSTATASIPPAQEGASSGA